MQKGKSENGSSPLLELTRSIGSGWKPISVKTHSSTEGVNVLKQTITLSYVKVTDPPEGEQALEKESNLEIKVVNESDR